MVQPGGRYTVSGYGFPKGGIDWKTGPTTLVFPPVPKSKEPRRFVPAWNSDLGVWVVYDHAIHSYTGKYASEWEAILASVRVKEMFKDFPWRRR